MDTPSKETSDEELADLMADPELLETLDSSDDFGNNPVEVGIPPSISDENTEVDTSEESFSINDFEEDFQSGDVSEKENNTNVEEDVSPDEQISAPLPIVDEDSDSNISDNSIWTYIALNNKMEVSIEQNQYLNYEKTDELNSKKIKLIATGAEINHVANAEKHLKSLGIKVTENVAHTGVVGILKGTSPGKVIALRADMDALPVEEVNEFEYRSQHPGKMHACGHDGHTVMALGAAKHLAENPNFLLDSICILAVVKAGYGFLLVSFWNRGACGAGSDGSLVGVAGM